MIGRFVWDGLVWQGVFSISPRIGRVNFVGDQIGAGIRTAEFGFKKGRRLTMRRDLQLYQAIGAVVGCK